jgi:hypothetical protein
MSLWRRTRNEMAGAWRSLRYDMGRRDDEMVVCAAPVPDVTSTGMSTFGGPAAAELREEYDEFTRPPRRLVAVSAFGVLAVVGAAGSYFAVVNGLGALLGDGSAAPQPYPLAAAAPTGAAEADSIAGMGRGTTVVRPAPATTADPVPPAGPAGATTTLRTPARSGQHPATPAEPGLPPEPDCDCLTPPVPTPTAYPSASPSDSASPSPSPSESASPSPSDTASAEPSASASTEQVRHTRRSHSH